MVSPGPSLILQTALLFPLECVKSQLVSKYVPDLRLLCRYLCICLESNQVKNSQERICGEPDPLVSTPKFAFKFPFVLRCFLLKVYQRLASFKVLTRSQFTFTFFLSPCQRLASFKVLTKSWAALVSASVNFSFLLYHFIP